jgi:outer membrane protein assembly factor BamB
MRPIVRLARWGLPLALFVAAAAVGQAAAAARPGGAPVATGDWPMYGHDPSRTNYNAAETTIGAGNAGQLTQRWQANIGAGSDPPAAAPSVANGRVFAGSSRASGNNFFAFDAVSGAPAWSAFVGYQQSCFNVGIGATPAIAGNVVVAGGGDGAYYGLNAGTGAPIWRHALNVGPSGFPWASPLIAGARAYIGVASRCDNPSVRGEVRALDLATGAQVANQYFVGPGQQGGGIWNSPALSPDGQTLAVATGEDYNCNPCDYTRAMVSLDPASLAIRQWRQEGTASVDQDFGTTPVIFHDSQGRALVGANHKNGTFYAYDLGAIGAGPVWSRNTGTNVGMAPAYDPDLGAGGTLFIAGGDRLYAVDPATGADRRPATSSDGAHGNMAIAHGLIFLNGGAAGLTIRDEATGALLRTLVAPNAGGANSGPAVANGFIYWLAGAYLNAWSLPAGAPTPTPPAPTPCGAFSDTHPSDYFYTPVQYLAARGVISGYSDCTFRPYNATTRAQMVKIVVNGFGIAPYTPPGGATFTDAPPSFPFYSVIEAAAHANIVSGYACGGPGEPCDSARRPYFRPYSNVTRGQLSKIVVAAAGWALANPANSTFQDVAPGSAFYPFVETAAAHNIISGYACGGAGEPCGASGRPYFRQAANAARGQIAKIVYNALSGLTRAVAP